MASATICKLFRFEAAHQLVHHDGKCARLHGHSYRVEVRARGQVKRANGAPDEGMVCDFAVIKDAWRPLHEQFDHQNLNDVLGFPTTAENLARHILTQLHKQVPEVYAVRVWETASAWAEASL